MLIHIYSTNKTFGGNFTMRKASIQLRPFQSTDITMFTSWLHMEHILKWYHEPDNWLTEINGRHDEYAWIHHYIVMHNNLPIGFCQYYDCYHAKDLESWYTAAQCGDMYSIDYFIGSESHLGKGYGKEIVRVLTEHIAITESPHKIIVRPDSNNRPSNSILLANGYVYDKQKKYYQKTLY